MSKREKVIRALVKTELFNRTWLSKQTDETLETLAKRAVGYSNWIQGVPSILDRGR